MAKVKKAEDELHTLLLDLYLIGVKSEKHSDKFVIPKINGEHPCDIFLDMVDRVRRVISFLKY